jgi:hypothetical protein
MSDDEPRFYEERDEREAREVRADERGVAHEQREHHSTAYDEQREQREVRADERGGAHEEREAREVRADRRGAAHEAREHDRDRRGRRDWRAAGGAYVLIVAGAVFGFFSVGENFDRISMLAEQRIEDQAETDRLVCEANNDQDALLSNLISGLTANGQPDAGESQEDFSRDRRLLLEAVEDLQPVDCDALPSQRPFEPR